MFVCVRIPHFPAWALAQADPTLSTVAFAVCERGQVIAPSPLALRAGITTGQSSSKANARLSSLLLVSRDKSCEALAWHEVQRALYGLTPKIEATQLGLLWCEVAGEKIARLLYDWNNIQPPKPETPKGRDIKDIPLAWGVSAGSSSDRSTAHLAALFATGGTCRQIKPGREASFVGGIPLKELDGEIARETIQRLTWFGWTTLSALRPLTRRQLEEQFDGKGLGNDGAALFRFAQGAKCRDNLSPVSTWQPPEEVTARLSFEAPATEPAEWNPGLVELLLRVCLSLGSRSARTLEVVAQTPLAQLAARRVLREPTNNPKTLLAPLQSALEEALRVTAPLPTFVEGFELRLGCLVVPHGQTELWEDPQATRQQKLHGAAQLLEDRMPGKLLSLHPQQSESPFEEEVWGWSNALEKLKERRQSRNGNRTVKGRHATTTR